MARFKTFICMGLFVLIAVSSSPARGDLPDDVEKSLRQFVQGFYDWYVPTVRKERGISGSNLVLRHKSSSFSPELLRAIEADSTAQAKSPNELVGLDFDPFVNAQEYADSCAAGKIVHKGDRYFVQIHCTWSGRKSAKSDVVPELTLNEGQWSFVNFHYGKFERSKHENLLSILKVLRANRRGNHQ